MVEPFQAVAHFNPIFYKFVEYRYGHLCVLNGSILVGVIFTGVLALASMIWVWLLFRNGYKLKA